MHHLFYATDLNEFSTSIVLSPSESRHAIKVLRIPMGSVIHVTNGKGIIAEVRMAKFDRNQLLCNVENIRHELFPYPQVYLAIGLIKSQQLEWALEKATELGVKGIIPVKSKFVVHSSFRKDRLTQILIAAMKQSLQAYLPDLYDPVQLRELPQLCEKLNISWRVAFDQHATAEIREESDSTQPALFVVGPEGGFDATEMEYLSRHQFRLYTLSPSRLRSETAAVAGLIQIQQVLKKA